MTKRKDPWDYSVMGIVSPERCAKVLRIMAEAVETSGVRKLKMNLTVVEPPRQPRQKKAKAQS